MNGEIKKHPLTAKGRYYVDMDCCIDHSCYDLAPANFKYDRELCTTYVYKQPETSEEEAQCREIMINYCPVESIRDDGE